MQSLEQALHMAQTGSEGDRRILLILNRLAIAYGHAGRYADAEHTWQAALKITNKLFGPESLESGVVLASITILSTHALDKSDIVFMQRVISAHIRKPFHREVVIVRIALAELLTYQGKYAKAQKVLQDTKAGLDRSVEADSDVMFNLVDASASLYTRKKRYAEALNLYQEGLKLTEAKYGQNHPALVLPLNNLAVILVYLGNLSAAEAAFQRALHLCNLFNIHQLNYGITAADYAYLLKRLGRKQEAERLALTARNARHESDLQNGLGMILAANP